MSSPLLLCLLVFFVFLLSLPSSSSSSRLHARNLIVVPSNSPQSRADKLIRGLNLSPKHDLNRGGLHRGRRGGAGVAPLLVERPLELASLIDGTDSGNDSLTDLGHHAGYFNLNNTIFDLRKMFYFFFESRTKNTSAPVVIWLTGGPGCSSELALFYENGPFKITDDLSLKWNEFGWDQASNLIYVDQPIGTGFSYGDRRQDEDGVSTDLYNFLQAFFTKHPEYVKNDFYITGESYAGHYIPAFASRVHKGNQAKEGIIVNLKGFAIGNGYTNPEIQYTAYPDFALDNKLIQKSDYDEIVQKVPPCVQATKLCQTAGGKACLDALTTCEGIFDDILSIAGDINYYDIRKQCEGTDGILCYDFSNMENFLNLENVRDALGVGDTEEFVTCSRTVYEDMLTDSMKNLEVFIPQLLEDGIRSLIYAGEYDLICNWLGNSKWAHDMPWSGKQSFNAAPTVPFLVDGKEAGLLQSSGPLTFLKVHNAGLMVPMDQPNNALEMLKRWIEGSLKV